MAKTINRELLAAFTSEVKSYLPQVRQSFDALNADPSRLDVLENAHRLVHSVKGAASMLGLSTLSHMAFLEEEAIEELACGQMIWSAASAEVLAGVLSLIETYLDTLNAGMLKEAPLIGEAVKMLRRLRGQPESGDEGEIALLLGDDGEPVLEDPSLERVDSSPSLHGMDELPRKVPVYLENEYANVPPDLLETFREESEEILQNVGGLLQRLEDGAGKQAMLDIRRGAHTLKGAAGSIGLRALSSLAHRMEDLLDAITQGTITFSTGTQSLLLATFDCLGDMAEAQNLSGMGPRTEQLYARYAEVLDPAPGANAPSVSAVPGPSSSDRVDLPIELADSFRAETEENLLRVVDGLRALEKSPEDKPVVLEIRRTIHTLKGASNMVGMRSMATLAHEMEDLLDALYEGTAQLSGETLALLFSVTDTLGDLAAGDNREQALARHPDLVARLSAASSSTAASGELRPLGAEKAIDIPREAEPSPADPQTHRSSQYVRVPIERLDELVRLVSELLVNRSTFEQHLSAYAHEVDELSRSTGRLKRISSRLDSDFEVSALRSGFGQLAVRAILTPQPIPEQRTDFDALEFDRYTDFHLISRDLTETTSDLASAAGELAHRITDFDSYLNRLARLTSEVQDKLMLMRMVPLSALTTRLRRTVRVTGERRQKPVELTIVGERVELDKTVLEEIAAPLEHLLRNAVDHGIETQSTRQVLGKPPAGQVRLRAFHEGTQVVIQVTDDGGGIEPELLREAAVRAGLYTAAQAEQLPQAALHNLIFQPGFSTARAVSETSGRGVGLDIVKSSVNRMKGTISIETEPGRGTAFTVRLPMTLAIMRVLLVKAHGETLAIPLGVVTQILRVEPHQIERIGQEMVVRVDGGVIPALRLGDALHLPKAADPGVRRLPVLIVSLGERQLALIVERLLEAREVVVKTMGTLLRRVDGVMGATLMGDGSVVLIVNPSDLAPSGPEETGAPGGGLAGRAASRNLEVLIVDDSVSVRRVLTNLVRSKGWSALTARDGVEALDLLDRAPRTPDVVLLDIEMPRMDGYEFLAALRKLPSYGHLPVIMLTSRTGEKHRHKAFDLGATDYLVKPYEEETLLTVIRRVVREAKETAVP